MKHWRIQIPLPASWHEVERRVFRPRGEKTGFVRFILLPAKPELIGNGERIIAYQKELIQSVGIDAGALQFEGATEGPHAVIGTSIWRHPKSGLIQLWLVPFPQVTVNAIYELGSLKTVNDEVAEAHSILKSVHVIEVKDSPLVRLDKDIKT